MPSICSTLSATMARSDMMKYLYPNPFRPATSHPDEATLRRIDLLGAYLQAATKQPLHIVDLMNALVQLEETIKRGGCTS